MGRGEARREVAPELRAVLDRRLRRAAQLSAQWPFAAEVLDFFRAVTELQLDVLARLPAPVPEDAAFMASFVPALLDLAERRGPAGLAGAARRWRRRPVRDWEGALRSFWGGAASEPAETFMAKAVLSPYALERRLEWHAGAGPGAAGGGSCPFCGHAPAVSVLREGESAGTAARSLVCSLCSHEWGFSRVLCPGCTESEPAKLPRFTAEELPWIRIEACEACRRYLKSVDLAKEPGADPIVDELASTPLDVLARENGFTKIEANLGGI